MMKSAKISKTIILVTVIVIIVNILSGNYFFRLDLTEGKEYTLSKATRNILKNLDKPVTVTAYFSKNLPPNIASVSSDLRDMLIEYGSRSGGMVVYKFVNPNESDELEQEAVQNGIQPVMINVREKDQVKQQKAYLGAVVSMGDAKEKISFFQPGSAMEYALSKAIKKLSVTDKPVVALLQGHGEPTVNEIMQAYTELSVLYKVESVTLTDTTILSSKFKTVALIRPTDSIPVRQQSILDKYLAEGGNMLLALDRVKGNFQNGMGNPASVGLEDWLRKKGITISGDFIIDASCGMVSLQQQQGNFTMTTQIQFPYFPIIHKFADSPITKGLESVSLQFASPITFKGDSSIQFTPVAFSSDKSGSLPTPLYFDVQKQWQLSDFPLSGLVVAGILEGKLSGNAKSRMVIISDGEFAVSQQQGMQIPPDNINLLVNSVDYLSDDTGLIDLRTKGITSRPIEELQDSTRALLKWMNFLLPIILIILYGLFRMQINRNKRIKRMEENYG
jgi:gliding-associated putative ABC transporter substrate-binding component GldG